MTVSGRTTNPWVRRAAAFATWPWALAAAALGALAVVAPIAAGAGLGGVILLLMAVGAPRTTVGLTVLAALFVRPLTHLVPVPELSYLDEAMVLLCAFMLPLRRLAARQSLRVFPGQWWFAGFVAAGLVSGLVLRVDPATFLTGAIVVAKGLVFAWAVAQVDWEERHLRSAAKAGVVLVVFCVAATAANFALEDPWLAFMASDENAVQARGALPSLVGPFSHPIDLGQFMTLSAIALTAWRVAVRKGPLTFVLMIATAAGSLLSARRTAIGSLVVAWVWVKATARSKGALLAVAVCTPLAAVLLATPLADVVNETYQEYLDPTAATSAARTVLTLGSFDVAADHFPLGAGFGRYGSATAAENYSPEYLARGFPEVWGLGRGLEDGRFLTDTEWPAIIGEAGFLGAIAFVAGLVAIYRAAGRLYRSSGPPLVRWVGLVMIGWIVACLVQSVATVTFTGPPVFGLLFGLVGIVAALSDADHSRSTPEPESRLRVSSTRSAWRSSSSQSMSS
jgi:hypothetical protein